ncbi:MAG TPA: cytochrome c biogenesis protein CcsA, partial [Chitinophagales bacterium]|nr:cytochrome c biogenesis protein CcsA [Chitinophagales bacterium]
CNNLTTVISPTHLNVEFGIPPDLRTDSKKDFYNLIIYNEQDGTFFLRDGFSIEKTDTAKGVGFKCTTILKMAPTAGITFPYREILYETIRNLFFHVPMWFTMIFLTLYSFLCSILFLAKGKRQYDLVASTSAGVGIFFGILGLLTGMQWANFTWGAPWVNDPKLNGAALGLLIYLAYFVLRGSLSDPEKCAKVASVYNVFAFVIFFVFIKIIPDMTDSLHPGGSGNPAFKEYDLDNRMKPVFYSAAAGFIIMGMWLVSLTARFRLLLQVHSEKNVTR